MARVPLKGQLKQIGSGLHRSEDRLAPTARLEQLAARLLCGLPPALQLRLCGGQPIRTDGQTLAPEIQLMLSLQARRGEAPVESLTPAKARSDRRRMAAIYAGTPAQLAGVEDLVIEADVPLQARHYIPAERSEPQPLLVYYHGGGFTYGDLETHDGLCRLLSLHSGAHVLAVDYRLAPEHRFPAAADDAFAALRWAQANAERLGCDPARIGVGGDSAGGNLAAVTAQLARDGGLAELALQLLIYPVTDVSRRRRSRELFAEGFLLGDRELDWYSDNYLGSDHSKRLDPRASPLLAEDLSGLAPAVVITAGFDPLRDEGEEYAQALQRAGTPALLRRYPAFIHAFTGAIGVSRDCRCAVCEIAGMTRMLFGAGP